MIQFCQEIKQQGAAVRKKIGICHSLAAVCCGYSLSFAQESVTLEKIEVQGAAQSLEERKENSIAKRIIKSEEVAKYGDLNALEILKRLPGVTIPEGKRQKGAPGKGYTVILIDGDETTSGSKRRVSPLEQISPDMIERIEIMTNGSAEYTAEAMGGIVNIVLKKPTSQGHTTVKLSGGAYGSAPSATLFAQKEGKEGALGYMVNLNVSDNQKNDRTNVSTLLPSSRNEKTRDDELRDRWVTLNAKLNYAPSAKTKYFYDGSVALGNNALTTDDKTYTDGSLSPDRLIVDRDRSQGVMAWSKVRGEHHLSGTELIEWKLKYHQNDQSGNSRSLQTLPSLSTKTQEDDSVFRVMGGEGSYSIAAGDHFIKTGIELKRTTQHDDTRRSLDGLDTTTAADRVNMREDKGSLFLQDEITVGEKIVVTPGIRYENVLRDYGSNADFSYFAPSIHLLYKLTSSDHIRSSVAKTVKLPRLNELSAMLDSTLDQNDIRHPDRSGNPNLKEESALSYELRYEHFFGDKGIAGIGAFYRTIGDKIEKLVTFESGRYIERPYNRGEGELWGIELELKKSLDEYAEGLNLSANATLQDSLLTNSASGLTRPIKQTSNVLGNVALDHTLKAYRITYGGAYRYVGGYNDPLDENGFSQSLKGYGHLDLYANKRLDKTFKLGLNLKNITHSRIDTRSESYDGSGLWLATQSDKERSKPQILLTLEGKW